VTNYSHEGNCSTVVYPIECARSTPRRVKGGTYVREAVEKLQKTHSPLEDRDIEMRGGRGWNLKMRGISR
jgi:hypothetical protein